MKTTQILATVNLGRRWRARFTPTTRSRQLPRHRRHSSATFLKTSAELQRFADSLPTSRCSRPMVSAPPTQGAVATSASPRPARPVESYKALYLSRIFTDLQPDNTTGWTNRAGLAASLGFDAEAAAAQANAEAGAGRPVVRWRPPGRAQSPAENARRLGQPRSALTADDLTTREGRTVVVSVKDDLSGVKKCRVTRKIQRQGRGPWATAQPVQVEDVLPNLFAMPQATPMDHKSVKGGLFALGVLAMAASAYASRSAATTPRARSESHHRHAVASPGAPHTTPAVFSGTNFQRRVGHSTTWPSKRTAEHHGGHAGWCGQRREIETG